MPTRCNRWFLLQILLLAQHVSGHHYAHHQELESVIQVVAVCRIWCLVFKLSVWCEAEGCVSGLRAAARWHFISTYYRRCTVKTTSNLNFYSFCMPIIHTGITGISNKLSWTSDKGWASKLGLRRGLEAPHRKLTQHLLHGRILVNTVKKRGDKLFSEDKRVRFKVWPDFCTVLYGTLSVPWNSTFLFDARVTARRVACFSNSAPQSRPPVRHHCRRSNCGN